MQAKQGLGVLQGSDVLGALAGRHRLATGVQQHSEHAAGRVRRASRRFFMHVVCDARPMLRLRLARLPKARARALTLSRLWRLCRALTAQGRAPTGEVLGREAAGDGLGAPVGLGGARPAGRAVGGGSAAGRAGRLGCVARPTFGGTVRTGKTGKPRRRSGRSVVIGGHSASPSRSDSRTMRWRGCVTSTPSMSRTGPSWSTRARSARADVGIQRAWSWRL